MLSLAVMLCDGRWAAYGSVFDYTLHNGQLTVIIQETPTSQRTDNLAGVVGLLIGERDDHPEPRVHGKKWDGKTIEPGTVCYADDPKPLPPIYETDGIDGPEGWKPQKD